MYLNRRYLGLIALHIICYQVLCFSMTSGKEERVGVIKKRSMLEEKFPEFFSLMPEAYRDKIFREYYEKFGENYISQFKKDYKENPFPYAVRALFARIASGQISDKGGYTFFYFPVLKGIRNEPRLDDFYKLDSKIDILKSSTAIDKEIPEGISKSDLIKQLEKKLDRLKEDLVEHYKIHLMPKREEVAAITAQLIIAISDDKELQNLITTFKVQNKFKNYLDEGKKPKKLIMPRIVIYPSKGKENAQKVLNKVIKLFNGIEGIDVVPRFNQKVTSLIYFAQGRGDDKIVDFFQRYFEQPNMIYYKSSFRGIEEDYRLV